MSKGWVRAGAHNGKEHPTRVTIMFEVAHSHSLYGCICGLYSMYSCVRVRLLVSRWAGVVCANVDDCCS